MPYNSSSKKLLILQAERRHSIAYTYVNGLLWGIATGLASTTLVSYFARELMEGISWGGDSAVERTSNGAGKVISWLIAVPAMVGLLRLFTPQLLEYVGSRKRFCVRMFLASAAVLFALPVLSAPDVLPSANQSIIALATTWAGYHVLEYMGMVALWSWFGDLVPRRIRGRVLGRRQAWANVGKVLGTIAAATGTYLWHQHCEAMGRTDLEWRSYALCGLAGSVFFSLSTWPLLRMVDLPLHNAPDVTRDSLRHQLIGPLTDRRFRRLLAFGLWFSLSNGLIQSAQFWFQTNVLNLSFVEKKALDSGSRGIQSTILPFVGKWVDRHGNVLVLTISQTIIACAPLFFVIASAEARWWIIGAYVCWLAYAGENVTQPNLMLGLSAPGETAAYASAWFAWTQLAFSLSVLLGGALYDLLADHFESVSLGQWRVDHFALLFLAAWVLKLIGAWLAARIPEP